MTTEQTILYENFILYHSYDVPQIAQGKCIEACTELKEIIPDLIICKGLVWGIDNHDIKESHEHMWMRDENDNIFDPTASQYALLHDIEYEIDKGGAKGRCRDCGHLVYSNSNYCNKCIEKVGKI